jgi:DNA-binding MarR family transcriptional regulator
MAELLNMPESTFRKNVNSLIEKGYIETETSIDTFTGLPTTKKIYNLTKLEQAIIFILKNHEDRLTKQEKEFQEFKDFILDNPQIRQKFEKFKSKNS